MNNKWLPLDKYKIYKNTDKMIITLGKGLLTFDAYYEDTKLIITQDTLEITETIDYFDNLEDKKYEFSGFEIRNNNSVEVNYVYS